MRIIVFDVPASEAGALTVLLDFYDFVVNLQQYDLEWIFVVSTDLLKEPDPKSRIKVLRVPDVKRNICRRMLFETVSAPRLVGRYRPDVVLSLQNTAILRARVPQVVYIQQSIPYAAARFSYRDPYERQFALKADIFRPLIGWSVRKSIASIVQTVWLKEAIERHHHIKEGKITVVPQAVRFRVSGDITAVNPNGFFYPAAPFSYKGFAEIVDAVSILKEQGLSPRVTLTIDGTENAFSRKITREMRSRGVLDCFSLAGRLPRDKVLQLYRKNALVFASRLESFGIPLLEARLLGTRIIATSQPFSREVLQGYNKAIFVEQGKPKELAEAMEKLMLENLSSIIREGEGKPTEQEREYASMGGWSKVIELLLSAGAR